jgi:hypothetical protein
MDVNSGIEILPSVALIYKPSDLSPRHWPCPRTLAATELPKAWEIGTFVRALQKHEEWVLPCPLTITEEESGV